MNKPKEFWLAGEPNEIDMGVWYDHEPDNHVVTGEPFWRFHVIEKSAYDELVERYEQACDSDNAWRSEAEKLKKEVAALWSVISEYKMLAEDGQGHMPDCFTQYHVAKDLAEKRKTRND